MKRQGSNLKKDKGLGLKKVKGAGQPGDPEVLTSFGGLTAVSEPRSDNPAATPCGSILIVELQPSSKVVGRTNAGGSSRGAEAGTICET